MKIGITYDLRSDFLKQGYGIERKAEFEKESTIEGIEKAINLMEHQTERIGNFQDLMKCLLNGKRWDMVFNIAEGLYGDGRESLVPALLDAYKIPYTFSSPTTLGISLNKAFAKQIVRAAGVNTPSYFVVTDESDIANITLDYPLFAKPISEGTGKGIDSNSFIQSKKELEDVCNYLLKTFDQPVLVEEFLPGREFTVGVLGSGKNAFVPGAMEIQYKKHVESIYSYENKENFEKIIDYIPVEGEIMQECAQLALKVWRSLRCFDGGRVDMRIDKHGKMSFIEVNPLAGLNPIISDLPILCKLNGMDYQHIIEAIVNSAIKRNFNNE